MFILDDSARQPVNIQCPQDMFPFWKMVSWIGTYQKLWYRRREFATTTILYLTMTISYLHSYLERFTCTKIVDSKHFKKTGTKCTKKWAYIIPKAVQNDPTSLFLLSDNVVWLDAPKLKFYTSLYDVRVAVIPPGQYKQSFTGPLTNCCAKFCSITERYSCTEAAGKKTIYNPGDFFITDLQSGLILKLNRKPHIISYLSCV